MSPSEVGRDLGVDRGVIRSWVVAAEPDPLTSSPTRARAREDGAGTDPEAAVRRLRRQEAHRSIRLGYRVLRVGHSGFDDGSGRADCPAAMLAPRTHLRGPLGRRPDRRSTVPPLWRARAAIGWPGGAGRRDRIPAAWSNGAVSCRWSRRGRHPTRREAR